MTEEGLRQVDDAPRQAARVHQLAGQHEEGHGQQRKAVDAGQHVLRQQLGVEEVEMPHQRDRGQHQGEGDGRTQRHGDEEHDEEDQDAHA